MAALWRSVAQHCWKEHFAKSAGMKKCLPRNLSNIRLRASGLIFCSHSGSVFQHETAADHHSFGREAELNAAAAASAKCTGSSGGHQHDGTGDSCVKLRVDLHRLSRYDVYVDLGEVSAKSSECLRLLDSKSQLNVDKQNPSCLLLTHRHSNIKDFQSDQRQEGSCFGTRERFCQRLSMIDEPEYERCSIDAGYRTSQGMCSGANNIQSGLDLLNRCLLTKRHFEIGALSPPPSGSVHVRCYTPAPRRKRDQNYYEVLNITPNATQAQVKEAFFKLSKVYHPDKNAGSKEAQRQFSSINEAYSVLGNLTLRKRYDRGTLSQKDIYGDVKEEEADKQQPAAGSTAYTAGGIAFQEEAERQAKKLDAFFESHYKSALEKEQQDRAERQQRVNEYMELQNKAKHSPIILAAFIMTAAFLAIKSVMNSHVDKKLRQTAAKKK